MARRKSRTAHADEKPCGIWDTIVDAIAPYFDGSYEFRCAQTLVDNPEPLTLDNIPQSLTLDVIPEALVLANIPETLTLEDIAVYIEDFDDSLEDLNERLGDDEQYVTKYKLETRHTRLSAHSKRIGDKVEAFKNNTDDARMKIVDLIKNLKKLERGVDKLEELIVSELSRE